MITFSGIPATKLVGCERSMPPPHQSMAPLLSRTGIRCEDLGLILYHCQLRIPLQYYHPWREISMPPHNEYYDFTGRVDKPNISSSWRYAIWHHRYHRCRPKLQGRRAPSTDRLYPSMPMSLIPHPLSNLADRSYRFIFKSGIDSQIVSLLMYCV